MTPTASTEALADVVHDVLSAPTYAASHASMAVAEAIHAHLSARPEVAASTLGDKIRAFVLPANAHGVSVVDPDARTLEGWAYQADRQADLLVREKGYTQAAIRSNLDLIKRLKVADDKLEAVRSLIMDRTDYAAVISKVLEG